jgi:hypothetical protein
LSLEFLHGNYCVFKRMLGVNAAGNTPYGHPTTKGIGRILSS